MTRKSSWETVAIVGVGLIGGSIGLAVRQRKLANRVIGIGRRSTSLRRATRLGVIDSGTTDLARGVAKADLIIVATPVSEIAATIRAVSAACPPHALITDVGSTKRTIVEAWSTFERAGKAPYGEFIGSHPIAGSEKSGPEFATAELFEGRNVVVTPTDATQQDSLSQLTRFWSQIGARVCLMSPAAHDEAMASISHLPHVVAAALAGITPHERLSLVGTGWLDSTRVAAGDADLWLDILSDNRKCTALALDRMIGQLQKYRIALERNQRDGLRKLLQEGKFNRDAVGN